jgi:hypothetical protein
MVAETGRIGSRIDERPYPVLLELVEMGPYPFPENREESKTSQGRNSHDPRRNPFQENEDEKDDHQFKGRPEIRLPSDQDGRNDRGQKTGDETDRTKGHIPFSRDKQPRQKKNQTQNHELRRLDLEPPQPNPPPRTVTRMAGEKDDGEERQDNPVDPARILQKNGLGNKKDPQTQEEPCDLPQALFESQIGHHRKKGQEVDHKDGRQAHQKGGMDPDNIEEKLGDQIPVPFLQDETAGEGVPFPASRVM